MKQRLYETLMDRYGNKYAITMAAAKRAEALNELSRPLIQTSEANLVSVALQEMSEGYVEIKNAEMLKVLVAGVKLPKKR